MSERPCPGAHNFTCSDLTNLTCLNHFEVLDDGDSSTAEVAKVSPGKRRRVHNETLPEEEDDAPLPKPSKRVAQA